MRFTAFLLLAPLAAGLVTESLNSNLTDLAIDSPLETLEKRGDCDYNGCKCDSSRPRKPQGQFCGGCHWSGTDDYVVIKKRVNSHVFECSPSGKCCDYGYAKDCARQDGTGRCGG